MKFLRDYRYPLYPLRLITYIWISIIILKSIVTFLPSMWRFVRKCSFDVREFSIRFFAPLSIFIVCLLRWNRLKIGTIFKDVLVTRFLLNHRIEGMKFWKGISGEAVFENALLESIYVLYFVKPIFPLARADIFQGYCSVNRAKYCSWWPLESIVHIALPRNFSFEYLFPLDRFETTQKVAVTAAWPIRDRSREKQFRVKIKKTVRKTIDINPRSV